MMTARESLVVALEGMARLYYSASIGLSRFTPGEETTSPLEALDHTGPLLVERLVAADEDPDSVAEYAVELDEEPGGPLDEVMTPWLEAEAEADREETIGPLPFPYPEWAELAEAPARSGPTPDGGWVVEKAGCVGVGSTREEARQALGRRLWVRLTRAD